MIPSAEELSNATKTKWQFWLFKHEEKLNEALMKAAESGEREFYFMLPDNIDIKEVRKYFGDLMYMISTEEVDNQDSIDWANEYNGRYKDKNPSVYRLEVPELVKSWKVTLIW